MTLTEFLLARIAEDEVAARYVDDVAVTHHRRWHNSTEVTPGVIAEPFMPARVLAECEAKRRIVERCAHVMGDEDDPRASLDEDGWVTLMWETMYDLASVYSAHLDYDPAWRSD